MERTESSTSLLRVMSLSVLMAGYTIGYLALLGFSERLDGVLRWPLVGFAANGVGAFKVALVCNAVLWGGAAAFATLGVWRLVFGGRDARGRRGLS